MTSSVDRVAEVLQNAGRTATILEFPAGTRTAADAAAAIGCTVAQIAKSLVFKVGNRPLLIIASGVNRVDLAKVATVIGDQVERADADWVRSVTGFAIGGVAPIGHVTPPLVLLDEDLTRLDPIWAAAGSPTHVFQTTAQDLVTLAQAKVVNIRQD